MVLPVTTQHFTMLQRNLVYTGITRGKRLVVIVGQRKAMAIAVKGNQTRRRWSKLRTGPLKQALTMTRRIASNPPGCETYLKIQAGRVKKRRETNQLDLLRKGRGPHPRLSRRPNRRRGPSLRPIGDWPTDHLLDALNLHLYAEAPDDPPLIASIVELGERGEPRAVRSDPHLPPVRRLRRQQPPARSWRRWKRSPGSVRPQRQCR